MKKVVVIASIVGALLIIADSFDTGHWLLLFVLAGVIPGTNISVAAIDVLSATATAATIVVLRITLWSRVRTLFFVDPIARQKQTKRRTV